MIKSKLLKDAIRSKYAWPGGYELFGITSDGACLCTTCMRSEWRQIVYSRLHKLSDGWKIIAIDAACNLESAEFVNENPDGYSLDSCAHCNKVLNQ